MVTAWPSCRPTSSMIVAGALVAAAVVLWVSAIGLLPPLFHRGFLFRFFQLAENFSHAPHRVRLRVALYLQQQRRNLGRAAQQPDRLRPINASFTRPEVGVLVATVVVHVRG